MSPVSAQVVGCPTTSGNSVCLTTYQGGPSRLGFNSSEPALTQAAITATTSPKFHKQYSVAVNGAIYAQPLVLPNVVIGTTTYADVVYVATEQDWVYAIDGSTGKILWSTNLAPSGFTYLVSTDLKCSNLLPAPGDIGITGTPVIDISGNQGGQTITSGVLYAVAKLKSTTTPYRYKQTLFALSIINGGNGVSATLPYASIDIGGTFNGITFNSGQIARAAPYALTQNQRSALLAVPVTGQNPQIVIAWGSNCDNVNFPYNGWVMAYQLNSTQSALGQTAIWASVPAKHTYQGGIWGGGSGPALDGTGHIFIATGNGDSSVKASTPPNDAPTACSTSPCDYGNSILEMQLSGSTFAVLDFFTAYDWVTRNTDNYDVGSGGIMLLPAQSGGNPQNLLVQAGKEGTIFLAQTSPVGTLGGFTGNGNSDATVQALKQMLCYNTAVECGVTGTGAWWSTTSSQGSTGYAYYAGTNMPLMQFQFYPNGSTCTNSGTVAGFCTTPTAQTAFTFGWPGPTPAVSAPSSTSSQAIVWLVDSRRATSNGPANLWAFDATTLNCLYTTNQQASKTACTVVAPATDVPSGIAVKFVVPSVANGKLYVGTTGVSTNTTQGFLNIYGIS
ncbi:MAG TPA: hypothetical protein VGM18_08855 [Candidatus Sulfotelmatobacter sp.]